MAGNINTGCKTNVELFDSPLFAEVVGDGKEDLKENLKENVSLRTNKYYSLDNQVRYIRAIIDKLRNKKAFSPLETKFLESNVFKNLPPKTVALLEAEGVLEHNGYIIGDGKGNYFINTKTISVNQSKREESASINPERLETIFATITTDVFDIKTSEALRNQGISTMGDIARLGIKDIGIFVSMGPKTFAEVKKVFDDDGLRFGMSEDGSLPRDQKVQISEQENIILDKTIKESCSGVIFEYFAAMNIKMVREIAAIGLEDIGEFVNMRKNMFEEVEELFKIHKLRFGMCA